MDHKTFIASLSAETRGALTRLRDGPGLLRFAVHVGAILLLGVAISYEVTGWPVMMLMQGILIVFLFTLLHETVHQTPFQSPWLNRVAGNLSGFMIGLSPDWFTYFHLAHHRFTQDPEKDPELATPAPQTLSAYLWVLTGLPVWYEHLKGLIHQALPGDDAPYIPRRAMPRIKAKARLFLALYLFLFMVSLIVQSDVLLWTWVFPALLGQPFLRLYLMAEHGRCTFVADMLQNTRTTLTSRLVRWIAWNMPYHAEHHAMPNAPFHQLPVLHEQMKPHLKVTERGYIRFHRALRQTFAR